MGQIRTEFYLNGINNVPALETDGEMTDTVVIVLHGSDVSKEINQPDMQRLEEAGFWSICIDAPHHGERNDGYMDIAARCNPKEQYLMMMSVVHQEAAEVAELIKYFKWLGKKVVVLGISMGAYAVFATLMLCKEADLYASFMGNPDFRFKESPTPSMLETSGPADNIEKIFPASLFMVNAGRDEFVNPKGARSLYERLKPCYANCPEKLQYFEYPESGHMMRAEDWFDAWDRLIARIREMAK